MDGDGSGAPPSCKFCAAAGHVTVETTISGGVAVVQWLCQRCHSKWPMTPDEQLQRRSGPPDRRKRSRTDRRRSKRVST